MPKTALILGATGQDGAHLAEQLISSGWSVFGGFRRGSPEKLWRLNHVGVARKIRLADVEISEPFSLLELLERTKPDHIYHLAGESFVADTFFHPGATFESNIFGTLNVLEAMRHAAPSARLFYASSAEIFGRCTQSSLLDEDSAARPVSPYGISKLSGQHLVRLYRESYGLFAASGILFNHEGPLRARNFVTRKISFNIARLRADDREEAMELGDLDAARDWGAAADYTKAMQAILSLNEPDDFVVATGELTSVRRFLELTATAAGFDPGFEGRGLGKVCFDKKSGRPLARVAERYMRPHDTPPLPGNAEKLMQASGWRPLQSIEDVARDMVAADIARRKKGLTDV